jgi:hypothetical protein
MNLIPTPELWNNPDFMDFIERHAQEQVSQLAFKYHQRTSFLLPAALEQISLRQKARYKLPEWVESKCLFTEKGLEQCSSALTAKWKARRIKEVLKVQKILDCNTGLGVDSGYFSQQPLEVVSIEKDADLVELARYNQACLGHNYRIIQGEVISWLTLNPFESFDLVYADPDRRGESGNRLADPDLFNPPVNELLSVLTGRSPRVLLKLSPLFDPREGIRIFPGVKEVWILSSQHECKEILYLLEKGYQEEVQFVAAAWFQNRWFEGIGIPDFPEEKSHKTQWVYLTDVAFILSGLAPRLPGILSILDRGGIALSDEWIPEYPGVAYHWLAEIPDKGKGLKQEIKKWVPEPFLNISTKGSPLKSEDLLKQLGKKPGGEKLLLIRPGISGAWLLERKK